MILNPEDSRLGVFNENAFHIACFHCARIQCHPGEGRKVNLAELKNSGEVILVLEIKGMKLEKLIDAEGTILFNVKDSQGILLATGLSLEKLSEQFPEIHHSLAG